MSYRVTSIVRRFYRAVIALVAAFAHLALDSGSVRVSEAPFNERGHYGRRQAADRTFTNNGNGSHLVGRDVPGAFVYRTR
jgi:hypothetical protein